MGDKEKLKELREKAQRLLDTAKGEKRDMNDTEKTEFDDLRGRLTSLRAGWKKGMEIQGEKEKAERLREQ